MKSPASRQHKALSLLHTHARTHAQCSSGSASLLSRSVSGPWDHLWRTICYRSAVTQQGEGWRWQETVKNFYPVREGMTLTQQNHTPPVLLISISMHRLIGWLRTFGFHKEQKWPSCLTRRQLVAPAGVRSVLAVGVVLAVSVAVDTDTHTVTNMTFMLLCLA